MDNATAHHQEIDKIREEFKEYLGETHPNWSPNTISMNYSDSFIIFNNNLSPDFWGCFINDETMSLARDKIYEYLSKEKLSPKAGERADNYLKSMYLFKDFLDEKYPGQAEKWSKISRKYFKTAFQSWMKKQKKSNGENYSSNTINAYTNALKNSTAKLNLDNNIHYDLFYYILPEKFEEAYSVITNAPGFNEIDLAAGNRAYSNGMILYKRFLKELNDNSFVKDPVNPINENPPKHKRYWMFGAGEGSRMWDEFYNKGIMGINWDELGDLTQYASKESMKEKMGDIYGQNSNYKMAGHATWQFANEINIGDVVYVKKGINKLIGRGIVKSKYIFDSSREEYRHIREVDWTHKGEWDHDGQAIVKTLTDITPYTDYYKKIESKFVDEVIIEPIPEYEIYTQDNFLNDVYMSKENYIKLKNLIKRKKNVILQGAPGVGKTYAAERLAYSIMGEKDTSRVMMVQFHQSYSYEDFIMGYRPDDNGFVLTKGPFYNFCKEAEPDDKDYFFIIDEINRGNLSKIFGELLMLIENDKRGKEIRLLYQDEQFSVPKNVHIIGMMNTADRSLAMIDYALRRRFAFYDFEPAFETDGFMCYQANIANKKFDKLIDTIVSLNKAISADEALGSGFRIGHSYFCTNEIVNDEWLMAVIEYELLPLIQEYWYDEPSKVENWIYKLKEAVYE